MTDYEGIVIHNSILNQKCEYCKEDLKGLANIQIKYGYKAIYICSGCLRKVFDSANAMKGFDRENNEAKILTNLNLIIDLEKRLKEVEEKCAKIPTNRKNTTKAKPAKKVDAVPKVQSEDKVRDTSESSGRGDGLSPEVSQL